MGGNLCSRYDDFITDPVTERPSAYVVAMRQKHYKNMLMQNKEEKVDTEFMTVEELRAYYDRGGASRLQHMGVVDQAEMFKRYTEEQNKKRKEAERKARLASVRKKPGQSTLRNKSIKARDFTSRASKDKGVNRMSNDSIIGINRLSGQSMASAASMASLNESADVSIMNLNDSMASDMMSVGGQSMAGISDGSQNYGVRQVTDSSADRLDTESNQDVIVRANGETTFDDMNNSMAGLSDVSMGEIQRVNDASMADLSMASLGEDSMAGVDDSGFKGQQAAKSFDKGGSQQFASSKTHGDTDSAQEDGGNMLDDLKQELGLPSVSNPQTDASFVKQQEIQDAYRASTVYDENEEYDSEEYDEEGPDGMRKSGKRKSFKKSERPSGSLRDSLKKPSLKLTDLVGAKVTGNKYQVEDAIEERSHTQESPDSSRQRQDTNESNGVQKFKLSPQMTAAAENSEDESSSTDSETDVPKNAENGADEPLRLGQAQSDVCSDDSEAEEAKAV